MPMMLQLYLTHGTPASPAVGEVAELFADVHGLLLTFWDVGGLILPRPYPWLVQPVSWKINREVAVVVFGWPAAILMQFAHPLVAAGVAQHSEFRAGLLTR